MERPRLLFAGLLLVWILIVGHRMLPKIHFTFLTTLEAPFER
jgi:hypothetical protein